MPVVTNDPPDAEVGALTMTDVVEGDGFGGDTATTPTFVGVEAVAVLASVVLGGAVVIVLDAGGLGGGGPV